LLTCHDMEYFFLSVLFSFLVIRSSDFCNGRDWEFLGEIFAEILDIINFLTFFVSLDSEIVDRVHFWYATDNHTPRVGPFSNHVNLLHPTHCINSTKS